MSIVEVRGLLGVGSSTVWVPGIELRLLGWQESLLTKPSCWSGLSVFVRFTVRQFSGTFCDGSPWRLARCLMHSSLCGKGIEHPLLF